MVECSFILRLFQVLGKLEMPASPIGDNRSSSSDDASASPARYRGLHSASTDSSTSSSSSSSGEPAAFKDTESEQEKQMKKLFDMANKFVDSNELTDDEKVFCIG